MASSIAQEWGKDWLYQHWKWTLIANERVKEICFTFQTGLVFSNLVYMFTWSTSEFYLRWIYMSLIMWCALRCAFKFLHEKKNIVMDATWFNGSKTLPITSKKRKEICCLFTGLVRFWWSIGDDHRREVFVKEVHLWKPFGEWWSWQAWQYQSMTSLTFRSFCSLPKTIIIIEPKIQPS